MTNDMNSEPNAFIEYFKARAAGASLEDAMAAAGATKAEEAAAVEREPQTEERELIDVLIEAMQKMVDRLLASDAKIAELEGRVDRLDDMAGGFSAFIECSLAGAD